MIMMQTSNSSGTPVQLQCLRYHNVECNYNKQLQYRMLKIPHQRYRIRKLSWEINSVGLAIF